MVQIPQGFPGAAAPFLEADGRSVSVVWYQFLVSLFKRTGSEQGDAAGSLTAPIGITPTASPFTYQAPANGSVVISGGGVTKMTLQRGTSGSPYPVGCFYGSIRVGLNDTLIVSYMQAPRMVFFPS